MTLALAVALAADDRGGPIGGLALGGVFATRYTEPRAEGRPRDGVPDEWRRLLDWTRILFEVIDMRSFSNLWYWIALAVTWSQASHWVLGLPFDMVLRARRQGGQAAVDLDDLARIYVGRLLYILNVAGPILVLIAFFVLTALAVLGFWYRVEFAQAVILLLFPLTLVGVMSLRTAWLIDNRAESGAALQQHLARHRVHVQIVGMISIFVTAFWGMAQNFNLNPLG